MGCPRARKRVRPGIETAEQRAALDRLKGQMVELEEVKIALASESSTAVPSTSLRTRVGTACAQALCASVKQFTKNIVCAKSGIMSCQVRPQGVTTTPAHPGARCVRAPAPSKP